MGTPPASPYTIPTTYQPKTYNLTMENISYIEPAANPKATLNIYYSDSTTDNCLRSLAYAHERSGAGEDTIIYLNTGQTERQLHGVLREATGGALTREGNSVLSILTSPLGEIAFKREAIAEEIRRRKITHIILNSWEFAAKDSRARNILIHTLLYFIDVFDVSITICAQQGEGAITGHITRGKLGRISAFADEILPLTKLPIAGKVQREVQPEIKQNEEPIHESRPTTHDPKLEVVVPEVIEPEEVTQAQPEPKITEAEILKPEVTQVEESIPNYQLSTHPNYQLPPPPRPAFQHPEPVAVLQLRRDKNRKTIPFEMRDGKRYIPPVDVDTLYTDENGKPAMISQWLGSKTEVECVN